jgi:two-component system chemotaxis sensor kinase CheA
LIGPLEEACAQQAARSGKHVRLALEGTEIRWPVRLAEAFDVLPHLIRNSIDHGIEAPGDRNGKLEVATIRLGVAAGDGLHISLRDDGRGIDTERVARRAVELGVITEDEMAAMSLADRLKLIFVGGLSTAEQVSETSGRGVGMAAIQRAVEALGGTLSVTSDLGRGTEFRIDFAGPDH